MGEHAGQEVGRPVGLEPGGLEGRQRERRGVGLAEPERRERLEDLPDPLDHRLGVADAERAREEPLLDLGHPLDVAEGTPALVGLGVGDAREPRDDLDDLLVEDHHALGVAEDRAQVVVEVGRRLPALLGLQVGGDHVALDRPGPEQRDVGDDVVEGVDAGLADQLALAGRLDLEHPEGLGGRDHPVGVVVVERHLALVVEVDLDAGGVADQLDGVGHRGLHADAEHVELEQAELLDVVLVELAHREPREAGLDGGAVEQGGVGEQHPARVDGDVAGQPVEPLDETEHQVEPPGVDAAGAQLGQLAQRDPGVAGADVGEGLGDGVDLARRHAERGADVADGVADAVGVHHRDAHAALAAEAVEDRLVDLGAARGLDVDVDVGQRGAQRREEPLHQEVVADRVDAGDAEEVVDQAAGARAARRAAHPALADQVGDVGDGEEVRRVAEAADQLELVVETLPDALARGRAVAVADRALAAGAQHASASASAAAAVQTGHSSSGKCTSPSPRSARGSRAQRSATARVRASSRCGPSDDPSSPASRQISSATSSICLPDLRKPSALPRSRWRRSRATSRRAASRTSTVGASRRSA